MMIQTDVWKYIYYFDIQVQQKRYEARTLSWNDFHETTERGEDACCLIKQRWSILRLILSTKNNLPKFTKNQTQSPLYSALSVRFALAIHLSSYKRTRGSHCLIIWLVSAFDMGEKPTSRSSISGRRINSSASRYLLGLSLSS